MIDDLAADQQRALTAMLGMQRQSWEQGVAAQAALDLGRHDLARVMARDAVARQTAAGKLAEIDDQGLVNSAANAEVVRWAAASPDSDPATAAELTAAFERQLRWIQQDCPRTADGTPVPPGRQPGSVGRHRLHGAAAAGGGR